MIHPCHMVRDTSTTRLLSRLAGFPRERCASLKILANKLLNRRIQVRHSHAMSYGGKGTLLVAFSSQLCSDLLLKLWGFCLSAQVGKRGHCSVEDAQAALDLYKLVEGEWEQELQNKLRDDGAPREPSFAASNHYMQDEYWPDDVTADSQWEESMYLVGNTSKSCYYMVMITMNTWYQVWGCN